MGNSLDLTKLEVIIEKIGLYKGKKYLEIANNELIISEDDSSVIEVDIYINIEK